jgi:Putative Flp pilus-assembly TadE/G-like
MGWVTPTTAMLKRLALVRDQAGNVAITFATTLPLMLGALAAAVDYSSAANQRSKLQAAADAAAISSAREFQMALAQPDKIARIAEDYVKSRLSDVAVNVAVDPKALTVRVRIERIVAQVIGKVLWKDRIQIAAESTARMSSGLPLCLVGLDTRAAGTISLEKNARMTAPNCLVYSNSISPQGIKSLDNAVLQAGYICSAGGKVKTRDSNFSPQPMTDCPVIADPLSSRRGPSDFTCTYNNKVVDGQAAYLNPGVYCGGLTVTNGAQVTLNAGIFVFRDGPLTVDGGSSFKGQYVGLYLKGTGANLLFAQASSISLTAPKDGPMTGILIFDDPSGAAAPEQSGAHPKLGKSPREHSILSDDARTLLGTIYMPQGRLIVDATKPVADRSAYTVMVVQQLDLYEGPNLYLNTDYTGSDIPTPQGLGPYGGKVMLTN